MKSHWRILSREVTWSDFLFFFFLSRSFCRGRIVRGQVWKSNNQLWGSCSNEKWWFDPASGHNRLWADLGFILEGEPTGLNRLDVGRWIKRNKTNNLGATRQRMVVTSIGRTWISKHEYHLPTYDAISHGIWRGYLRRKGKKWVVQGLCQGHSVFRGWAEKLLAKDTGEEQSTGRKSRWVVLRTGYKAEEQPAVRLMKTEKHLWTWYYEGHG